MKRKISLLFMFFFALLIIGCNEDQNDPTPKPDLPKPSVEISKNLNVNSIVDFKITNLDELGLTTIDDLDIIVDEEYFTYLKEGYLVIKKAGTATITITYMMDNQTNTTTYEYVIGDNTSTNEVPNFKISKNYMTIDSSIALRLSNYSDLSLFDIILSDNTIIEIDDRNRISPLNTGKVDIYLRLKDDFSCVNKFSLEVISILPKIFVNKDTVLVNEYSYLNISNLNETYEKSLDEYIWTVDSDHASITNNTFVADTPGTYIVTATSIHNPLVSINYKINVVQNSDNVILSLEEEYLGKAGKGDQFHLSLNNNYYFENFTFGSSDEEILRVTAEGIISVVNEGYATITAYEKGNASNKSVYRFYVNGVSNIDYIDRLLTQALGEVGTVERMDENGNYVNDTKYNHWYNYDGPWCAMFVSWNWYHAGLSNDLLVKYMGCTAGMDWCVEQGIFHYKEDYTPKSGDIVFFLSNGAGHTGIVVYCDGDYIYTVEGNRSNRVDVWRLSCTNDTITGYASPNYPEYIGTPADFSWIAGKDENGEYYWTPAGNQSIV